jgi:hypothetical protein
MNIKILLKQDAIFTIFFKQAIDSYDITMPETVAPIDHYLINNQAALTMLKTLVQAFDLRYDK